MRKKKQPFTIILTGLSGSGKSVALNAFEDSNYFCVDNLPISLIKTFVHLCHKTSDISKIAIGVDIRERKFYVNFDETVSALRKTCNIEIIFLQAKKDVLLRRFKETRRPHPLGYKDLKKAIHKEMKMLSTTRDAADRIIDTSSLTPHQLRETIMNLYHDRKEKTMSVSLISFGYKYGIPDEADLLFDVRFLPNPNFVKTLKQFNGTNPKIKNFLMKKQETKDFLARFSSFLEFLIPRYRTEGRNYLTIGVGCTGGKHRSPVIVEEVKKTIKKQKTTVSVTHRDMQ